MTTTAGDAGPPPALPPAPSSSLRPPAPFTRKRPRASWGRRVLAVLLDSAIVAAVVWFATSAELWLPTLPLFGERNPPLSDTEAWWTTGSCLVLLVLQAYTGMTPGKRVVAIAVVGDASGRPVGVVRTVLRSVAHFLDAILMIGYLRPAWHPEGRTFADSLLHTVVVRSTRPRPHRWVAALRRGRDARAPWLRWPHWVTGGLAGVLCAVAVAACVFQGSGGASGTTESASCLGTGTVEATAVVELTPMVSGESMLGVWRETEHWQVAAGWFGDQDAVPVDTYLVETTLGVESPDGQRFGSTAGVELGTDEYWLQSQEVEQIGHVTGIDMSQDVSGWTATVTLVGETADVLAECTVTLPEVAPLRSPFHS